MAKVIGPAMAEVKIATATSVSTSVNPRFAPAKLTPTFNKVGVGVKPFLYCFLNILFYGNLTIQVNFYVLGNFAIGS
ncbi:MAG: hypothetical protein Q8Q21_01660, partial [bacterium]|nr:hypothetical protein [bacterium]